MNYHDPSVPGVGVLPRKPAPCDFFPPMARDALIAASQTPIPSSESPLRIVAIDKAIERVKAQFPERFHKEF